VLLLGLIGSLLLDGNSDTPTGTGPATSGPAEESTPESSAPAEPATTEPATTQPTPVTLRELAAQFAAALDQAVANGQIDRKTASGLREKAAELDRGKPKDRAKRVDDLRERIDEAVDDSKIDEGTADALQQLLDSYEQVRGNGRDQG
jgi:serine/threonine-protein kinase